VLLFAVAGADRGFVWADAVFEGGTVVVVDQEGEREHARVSDQRSRNCHFVGRRLGRLVPLDCGRHERGEFATNLILVVHAVPIDERESLSGPPAAVFRNSVW
jgi:hypothetical protein